MPIFKYEAVDLKGVKVSGERESASLQELQKSLKQEKVILRSYKEIKAKTPSKAPKTDAGGNVEVKKMTFLESLTMERINNDQLIAFTRELAVMIESGLSLLGALNVQNTMMKKKNEMKKLVEDLRTRITQGQTFYSGFAPYEERFGSIYVNLVKVGEVSGNLGSILGELAELLEKNEEIKRKVKSAMTYPITVMSITIIITAFLIVKVLPTFVQMFSGTGVALPGITQFLLDISDFLKAYWWKAGIFLAVFGTIMGKYLKTENGKKNKNRLMYQAPILGILFRQSVTLRFCRTLGTLMDGGVSVIRSFDIAAESVGCPYFLEKINEAKEEIQGGGRIATSLQRTQFFSVATISMMAVGEESGELTKMLKKIAAYNERELNNIIADALTLIEPAMTVMLGGIIGTIVMAMYLPMFDMMGAVDKTG